MRKKKELLMEYQPTAGVNSDFEQLLQRFTSTETVRFEHFSEIWREMKMSFIFAGRDSERECREFTESIMKMALKYILPPYNFQVRVGGLYLLYGLFYQQPLIRKVRIRVTPDIWDQIIEFQTEARRQQHLDVNYVFHKLRVEDAFNFSATESEVYFNLNTAAHSSKDPDSLEEFKDEQTVLYDLFSDQFLQQLTQLHDHYHNVKVGLEGPTATEPSRSLNVIQTDIVPNIYGTVMTYQNRKKYMKKTTVTDTEDDIDDEDYNPRGSSSKSIRSKLKAKAFRNVARAHKSRRHRQAVESADESPEKPLLGQRQLEDEDWESTPKKKKRRKAKIKIEHEEIEDMETEETAQVMEGEDQEVLEEEVKGEIIPKEFLDMPLLAEDNESSIDLTKKKPGRPRSKQKNKEKQNIQNEKQDLITPKKRGRPRKSDQNNDLNMPGKTQQNKEKNRKDSSEQEHIITEKGDSILHMPSFEDVEKKKPIGKKSAGSSKKKKSEKAIKGKMPSIKLSPLKRKQKGVDN